MRTNHAVAALLAIFILWASLFITVLSQSARTNQLLRNDSKLLSQQKQTLDSIAANAKIRTAQINSLQGHIDCLFNLATQPNRTSAYISNAQACTISATPARPSSAAVAAPQSPSKVFVSGPSAQSAPTQSKTQADNPAPSKPSIIKQILNFLNL